MEVYCNFKRNLANGTIEDETVIYSMNPYKLVEGVNELQKTHPSFVYKSILGLVTPKRDLGPPFYYALGPYLLHAKNLRYPTRCLESQFKFFLKPSFNTLYYHIPIPGHLVPESFNLSNDNLYDLSLDFI